MIHKEEDVDMSQNKQMVIAHINVAKGKTGWLLEDENGYRVAMTFGQSRAQHRRGIVLGPGYVIEYKPYRLKRGKYVRFVSKPKS
jgi:hypothetical protein